MRSIILAATVFTVLLGATAEAKSERGCRAKGTCEPRQASATMKACSAQWKEAKANPTDTNAAKVAAGWMTFWSECANAAKVARTLAP